MDEGGGTINSPTETTTMMKKTAFKRYTKRVLAKGDAEEADAWLLAYPLFSTSSSSPTRELFDLWEKRYPTPIQPSPLPPNGGSPTARPQSWGSAQLRARVFLRFVDWPRIEVAFCVEQRLSVRRRSFT
jgi:hypothetical protein